MNVRDKYYFAEKILAYRNEKIFFDKMCAIILSQKNFRLTFFREIIFFKRCFMSFIIYFSYMGRWIEVKKIYYILQWRWRFFRHRLFKHRDPCVQRNNKRHKTPFKKKWFREKKFKESFDYKPTMYILFDDEASFISTSSFILNFF